MGWGMIAAGHGRLPNPAPATLELLKGLPVYGTDLPGELVTPTGAAILKACEARCEPCPAMTLAAVGYGAGSRDLPGHPNLLRLYLGTPLAPAPGLRETGPGPGNPPGRHEPGVVRAPHGRPLCRRGPGRGAGPHPDEKEPPRRGPHRHRPPGGQRRAAGPAVRRFHHPGGAESWKWSGSRPGAGRKPSRPPYGPLQVKVMEYGGRRRLLPEYEACRRMAEAQGLPLIEVYRLVPRE